MFLECNKILVRNGQNGRTYISKNTIIKIIYKLMKEEFHDINIISIRLHTSGIILYLDRSNNLTYKKNSEIQKKIYLFLIDNYNLIDYHVDIEVI